MLKLIAALPLVALAAPSSALAAIGPHAAACNAGQRAVIARIGGFKARTGRVRVQIYRSDKSFLERRAYLQRVDIPTTRSGSMDVCVTVPRPGNYAISVRHDANGNNKTDRADGGGFSGNPRLSITDLAFKKKPSLARVGFTVGAGTKVVPITLNYVQGLSVKPIA